MIEAFRRHRPALAIVAALLLASCGGTSGAPGGGAVLSIDTGDGTVEVQVEIADTEEERQVGLMNRGELAEDAGMVFLHETPTAGGFWMKNTLIPLTVAFWDESGEILAMIDMVPCEKDPCTIYDSGETWLGAVEVNRGFLADQGVEVGDTITLSGVPTPGPATS